MEGLGEFCVKFLALGEWLATVVMTRLLLCAGKIAKNDPVQ